MTAPIVEASLQDPQELRKKLQMAINRIAEMYEVIGEIPYRDIKELRQGPLGKLVTFYENEHSFLTDLAADDIPF